MNPILFKLRTIAQQIAEVLAEDTRVSAILLFGSAAYGVVSDTSDIDLEVLCKPHILSAEERIEILSEITRGWKIDKYGRENSLFSTVDVHEGISSIKVEACIIPARSGWKERSYPSFQKFQTDSLSDGPRQVHWDRIPPGRNVFMCTPDSHGTS